MQAFKAALRIVLNHPVYLLVYVGFLSFMGVFLASSIDFGDADDEGFEAVEVPFAVIDRDGSALSEGLTGSLSEIGAYTEVADDPFAMQDDVATGMVRYLIVIPKGFEEAYLEAARLGDAAPKLEATYSFSTMGGALVDEQANQYLGLVRAAAVLEPDAPASAVVERADHAAAESVAVETVQTPGGANPADRFAFYLQWGSYTMTAAIVVCVGLLMSAFNRTDVRRRNAVSPLGTMRLGLQKAAACLAVTATVWAITCGIGLIAFEPSLEGVPVAAIALTLAAAFAFSLVPLSLGFFLGQIGASEMVANAVGNIAGMAISFLGGAWVSIDLLAPEVQVLSRFVPTSWYTEAVGQAIRLTELTPETVLPILSNIGVVALFAVALFAVALAVGRLHLRSAEAGGNAAAKAAA